MRISLLCLGCFKRSELQRMQGSFGREGILWVGKKPFCHWQESILISTTKRTLPCLGNSSHSRNRPPIWLPLIILFLKIVMFLCPLMVEIWATLSRYCSSHHHLRHHLCRLPIQSNYSWGYKLHDHINLYSICCQKINK